jgi:superoxide reductase
MSKEIKFFRCNHCGNIVGIINNAGVPLKCCGEDMEELVANTVEASKEKHVPVVTIEGNTVLVEVGSVAHPMEEKHYIQWIYIQTERGGQRKNLEPGDAPKASFALVDDEVVAVYEYCNIHGLWKTDIK